MGDVASTPAGESPSPEVRRIVIEILVLHVGLASLIALIPFDQSNYPNRPLIGLILGIGFAQISLAATWCALGPGRFFLRVPLALMAATLAGLAIAAFMIKASPNAEDFWMCVALSLAGWLLLQPPLWFVSVGLKYSVRLSDEKSNERGAGTQFTLAHLLLWTLGVAMLLGIGRMALRDVQIATSRTWLPPDFGFFLVLLVVNFVLAVPVILVVLGMKSRSLRVVMVSLWSLALAAAEFFCLMLIIGAPAEPSAVVLLALMNGFHGMVLGGSLLMLTEVGYRLRRDKAGIEPLSTPLNPAISAASGQFQPILSKD